MVTSESAIDSSAETDLNAFKRISSDNESLYIKNLELKTRLSDQ